MKRNTKGSRDIKQIVTYWVLFSSDIIQYIYIYILWPDLAAQRAFSISRSVRPIHCALQ